MDVLLTFAQRHGAVEDVAGHLAGHLRERGLPIHLVHTADVDDVTGYDAVVVGAGSSGPQWLRPAARFVQQHEQALARRPLWLFETTPTPRRAPAVATDDELPTGQFDDVRDLVRPEGEAAFPTTGTPGRHGLAARLQRLLAAPRPTSDAGIADWPAVDAWAEEVADRMVELGLDRPAGLVPRIMATGAVHA